LCIENDWSLVWYFIRQSETRKKNEDNRILKVFQCIMKKQQKPAFNFILLPEFKNDLEENNDIDCVTLGCVGIGLFPS